MRAEVAQLQLPRSRACSDININNAAAERHAATHTRRVKTVCRVRPPRTTLNRHTVSHTIKSVYDRRSRLHGRWRISIWNRNYSTSRHTLRPYQSAAWTQVPKPQTHISVALAPSAQDRCAMLRCCAQRNRMREGGPPSSPQHRRAVRAHPGLAACSVPQGSSHSDACSIGNRTRTCAHARPPRRCRSPPLTGSAFSRRSRKPSRSCPRCPWS